MDARVGGLFVFSVGGVPKDVSGGVKTSIMDTIQKLFQFVLQRERTVVFGNLSRYPQRIYDALVDLPHLQVTVVSKRYPFASSEYRIRVVPESGVVGFCDVLMVLEPDSLQMIQKPPLAAHVVIFTTHFTFQTYPNDDWTDVCYFHAPSPPPLSRWMSNTQTLLGLQDFSLQTGHVDQIDVHHANVSILRGRPDTAPTKSSTYFIVDLTKFNKDTLSMYLAFWDAFDYMLDHLDSVHRWVVCFSEHNGRYAFERFTQKTIDVLLCKKFEHGNVTKIHDILSLIPFYKSGIIDTDFHVPVSAFGGNKIVIPKTMREACKSAILYDLDHLSKTVYCIRE